MRNSLSQRRSNLVWLNFHNLPKMSAYICLHYLRNRSLGFLCFPLYKGDLTWLDPVREVLLSPRAHAFDSAARNRSRAPLASQAQTSFSFTLLTGPSVCVRINHFAFWSRAIWHGIKDTFLKYIYVVWCRILRLSVVYIWASFSQMNNVKIKMFKKLENLHCAMFSEGKCFSSNDERQGRVCLCVLLLSSLMLWA